MSRSDNYSEISKLILSIVPAEKIFILAVSQLQSSNHLYLLILISKEQNCFYADVQNKIESVCEPASHVSVIAMEMEMFNEWLGDGHPFAIQTKTNALLIFDRQQIRFVYSQRVNETAYFDYRRKIYQSGIAKMQRLINENKFYAACVEGLLTILKATIGLELVINDIDKLIDYCTITIKQVPKIFPGNNYNAMPPVEKIEALLKSLYAPYQLLEMKENSFS